MKIEISNTTLHAIFTIIICITIPAISIHISFFATELVRGNNIADLGIGPMFKQRTLALWTGILIYMFLTPGLLLLTELFIENSRWIVRYFGFFLSWLALPFYYIFLILKYS